MTHDLNDAHAELHSEALERRLQDAEANRATRYYAPLSVGAPVRPGQITTPVLILEEHELVALLRLVAERTEFGHAQIPNAVTLAHTLSGQRTAIYLYEGTLAAPDAAPAEVTA